MGIDEQLLSIAPTTRNLLRRTGFLKPIVQYILVEQQTNKLTLSKETKEKAFNDFCNSKALIDKNQLMLYLEEHCLKYDELLEKIAFSLKKEYYSLQEFGSKAESHFLRRKDALDKVVYSLLRVKDQDVAYDLYLRIEEEKSDFISLAQHFSEGPEKNSYGKIGPVSLSTAHPLLRKLLENQQTGLVLEPVLIEDWWVVARLEERIDAVFDETMKRHMACELFEDWLQNESKKVITSLLYNQDG